MKNRLKIVTFNLRYNVKTDALNIFDNRKGLILSKIDDEAPDIIGFQEMGPAMKRFLAAHLPEYNIVGRSRAADYTGEHVDIAYRKSTVDLYALDYFWLSPSPRLPGSRYEEQSNCPRITTVGIFRHRDFATPFRVYNTHLDHVGEGARVLGMKQILARIETDNVYISGTAAEGDSSLPFFLMGDMNAMPDSECIALTRSADSPPMADLTESIPVTFHGYGKTAVKIDYIFADRRSAAGGFTSAVWDDCNYGVYLSDHYPVCAEIDMRNWS